MIDCICEVCGKPFCVYPAAIRKGGGHCCGILCRNRRLASLNVRDTGERFWEKVKKTDNCWLWIGAATKDGYGMLKPAGAKSNVRANRLSWQMHFGPIPDGLHVLHKCDTPACVNPDHLFLGTDADNSKDRNSKKRQAHGERSGSARLTEAKVLAIRREYATMATSYSKLSVKHKVARGTIQAILEGRSWKHLPMVP